jgi:predicted RNase H-like nuclease (RuvC/YqgF family)
MIYALRCVFAAAPWKPTIETRDEQWNVGNSHPLDAQAQLDAYTAARVAPIWYVPPVDMETVDRTGIIERKDLDNLLSMAQRNHERYAEAFKQHKLMRDMTLPEDETERLKAMLARLETNMKALRDENEKLADEASHAMDAERKARAELAAVRATLQSWHRKRVSRVMQAEIRKLTERLG